MVLPGKFLFSAFLIQTHTHTHTHRHTRKHARTHACTHTHTHTHIHTHYLHALSRNIPIIRPVQGQNRVYKYYFLSVHWISMSVSIKFLYFYLSIEFLYFYFFIVLSSLGLRNWILVYPVVIFSQARTQSLWILFVLSGHECRMFGNTLNFG